MVAHRLEAQSGNGAKPLQGFLPRGLLAFGFWPKMGMDNMLSVLIQIIDKHSFFDKLSQNLKVLPTTPTTPAPTTVLGSWATNLPTLFLQTLWLAQGGICQGPFLARSTAPPPPGRLLPVDLTTFGPASSRQTFVTPCPRLTMNNSNRPLRNRRALASLASKPNQPSRSS